MFPLAGVWTVTDFQVQFMNLSITVGNGNQNETLFLQIRQSCWFRIIRASVIMDVC